MKTAPDSAVVDVADSVKAGSAPDTDLDVESLFASLNSITGATSAMFEMMTRIHKGLKDVTELTSSISDKTIDLSKRVEELERDRSK
jgi:hypothetical protein